MIYLLIEHVFAYLSNCFRKYHITKCGIHDKYGVLRTHIEFNM